MIVFFPSYKFLNTAKAFWTKSGMLEKFGSKKEARFRSVIQCSYNDVYDRYSLSRKRALKLKRSFRNTQRLSRGYVSEHRNLDIAYQDFSFFFSSFSFFLSFGQRMKGKRSGAVLLAVIGAKLSEGLNFADDLARGVVIVGLPFANLGSPELRERLKYVKNLDIQRGISPKEMGQKDAAAELYENMCMNAVNQSIGEQITPYGFSLF
jgi:chromosome transmission fidelity protein 1